MELNFTEIGNNNKKRVTFEYEGENDDGAEDVAIIGENGVVQLPNQGSQQNIKLNVPNLVYFFSD